MKKFAAVLLAALMLLAAMPLCASAAQSGYVHDEVLDDGTVVRRKYIDYTVNTDERICDGFYYATTLKHLKRLLSHPEQLDKPAPVVNHDIE